MSLHHLHMRQLSLCVQCGRVACIAVVLARFATFLTRAAGCDAIKEVKRCQLQLREWLLLHLALSTVSNSLEMVAVLIKTKENIQFKPSAS